MNKAARPVSHSRPAALIAQQATADCHNDSEAHAGFLTMIEDNPAMPFTLIVLGAEVKVVAADLQDDDSVVVLRRCGKARQRIPILDLPLPLPPPAGSRWIEAYRAWVNGAG